MVQNKEMLYAMHNLNVQVEEDKMGSACNVNQGSGAALYWCEENTSW
jgi:hypothetical protein